MRINDTKSTFERFLRGRNVSLDGLLPADAVDAMMEFYRLHRSTETVGGDGDALLFQWGTYDWGEGENFEFDLTRQLISHVISHGGSEDSDIWQLHLTLRYAPSRKLKALPESNRWCWSVDELSEFESFVRQSAVFKALSPHAPASVHLAFETV